MIDIILNGWRKELENLDRMERELPPAVNNATQEAVLYVHSTVPEYPATRPGQSYTRTGTLGRSITTKVRTLGAETIGVIGTNVDYAPWVISSEAVGSKGPQAWMHQGRWWTLQNVVEKAQDKVTEIFEKWVGKVIRR